MDSLPFDKARLQLVAETPEEAHEVLQLFLDSAREKLALMDQAIENDDLDQWKTASHGLQGIAGNLGMTSLIALCTRAGKFQEMNSEGTLLYQAMQAEIERVSHYLSKR